MNKWDFEDCFAEGEAYDLAREYVYDYDGYEPVLYAGFMPESDEVWYVQECQDASDWQFILGWFWPDGPTEVELSREGGEYEKKFFDDLEEVGDFLEGCDIYA